MKFAWKTGFSWDKEWYDFKIRDAGFDKNGYENECIIIRKWLDSEKTVDLWEVWEFLMWFWGWWGVFYGDGVWIFAVKCGNYRKVYRKIFSDFCVVLIFFISVMGKWNRLCLEMPLAKFSEFSDNRKCKIPTSYFFINNDSKKTFIYGLFFALLEKMQFDMRYWHF